MIANRFRGQLVDAAKSLAIAVAGSDHGVGQSFPGDIRGSFCGLVVDMLKVALGSARFTGHLHTIV